MTIGVGFKCTDGIVIAADTQYTRGLFKTSGPKIFHSEKPGIAVVAAGSGHVGFMKRAFEQIETDLAARTNLSCVDARDCIENTLHVFFNRHAYPIPNYSPDKYGFDLIIGVWSAVDGYKLFQTSDTAVTEVAPVGCNYCTIGYGFSVAEHALGLTYPPAGTNVESAKFIAALSVKSAKEYSDYCGGKTNIWTLKDEGSGYFAHRVSPIDVTDAEQYSEDLFDTLRTILECLDPDMLLDDDSVRVVTDMLKDSVISFKTKQRERKQKIRTARENAEKMRASLARLRQQQSERAQPQPSDKK